MGTLQEKRLHIISFTVPYPPDYGGVIDVFYKIKELHRQGVKIYLHCFFYNRKPAPELEEYCEKVIYYPRKTGFFSALKLSPYTAASRVSEELVQNLLKNDYPILFETLHTCACLNDKRLKGRFKIYRESNIEHEYYRSLARIEKPVMRKIYFYAAALKLLRFQNVLKHASLVLAVSRSDTDYLQKKFPEAQVEYLPSFHPDSEVTAREGKGSYALYHGNLSVAENAHAAAFLIKEVLNDPGIPFVVAGLNPPAYLEKLANSYSHIRLIKNPPGDEMSDLIANAHINVLVTFQATGLKLKLLNVLFKGRFCLANPLMLEGTGLDSCCIVAGTAAALKEKIKELFNTNFDKSLIEKRKVVLSQRYSNEANARQLVRLVFGR